jgi:hypothetical protein
MQQILPVTLLFTTPLRKATVRIPCQELERITELKCSRRIGDAAVALIKAGADATKRDSMGQLALDLAPDKEVCLS